MLFLKENGGHQNVSKLALTEAQYAIDKCGDFAIGPLGAAIFAKGKLLFKLFMHFFKIEWLSFTLNLFD